MIRTGGRCSWPYRLPGSRGGGVIAEGYRGIPIRKGERYDLSFFAKGANMVPRTIRVALEDPMANTVLSDVFQVAPLYEWKRYRHTFTVTGGRAERDLTITPIPPPCFGWMWYALPGGWVEGTEERG